jgi:hypothetical protein
LTQLYGGLPARLDIELRSVSSIRESMARTPIFRMPQAV